MPDIATLTIESYAIDPPQINVGRIVFDLTKRFIDIILGTIALILLSPIILLCALIVRFSSQGSVIYKQLRVGKDGRLFEMYKLRTMVADAEQSTGPVWEKRMTPASSPHADGCEEDTSTNYHRSSTSSKEKCLSSAPDPNARKSLPNSKKYFPISINDSPSDPESPDWPRFATATTKH